MNSEPNGAEQGPRRNETAPVAADPLRECPLSESDQRRNSFIFIASWSLVYLAAPVVYVGIVQAAICERMGTSDTVANLPQSVYMWLMPTPVLVAWLLPSQRFLKPLLISSFLALAAAGALVAVAFVVAPRTWIPPAIILHAAIVGVTNSITFVCLWELAGRGMTAARRGKTLGWTYGLGPVLAVLGSFLSQLLLNGSFLDLVRVPLIAEPWRYVILYAATAPGLGLAGLLGFFVVLPPPEPEPRAESVLANIGSGVRQFVTNRFIVVAAAAYLITYAGGNMILPNMSLYTQEVTGESPEAYAGLQMVLRFTFKIFAGFSLGWIVAKTHPKAGLLVTTSICLAGVLWALVVPGKWYLVSFGLIGAGELFGVYFPNYIVTCSAPARIRENVAYLTLLTFAVGFAGGAFGIISDAYGRPASFIAAAALLVASLAMISLILPKKPSPDSPPRLAGRDFSEEPMEATP